MKCLFICNPKSGRGKKDNDRIISRLKSKFDVVDFVETKYRAHVTRIINEQYINYDSIIITGGDGTLNEAINALAEKKNAPTLGYIPSGTCNDVARSLRIPTNIDKALDIILAGKCFEYDLMKVNHSYCIYVCGIGIFTSTSYATNQNSKKKLGRIAYFFYGLKDALVGKTFDVQIESEQLKFKGTGSILLFINSKSVAGFKLNKKALLDDGKVDVCLIHEKKNRKRVSFWNKVRIAKLFILGYNSMKNNSHIKVATLDKAKVKSCVYINQDGECGECNNFNLEVLKKGVKIYVRE